jgi:SAM-dependent methyltransferase
MAYWDTAAETYDRDFTETVVGKARRDAVWRELDRLFVPGQHILELNCGTGIDALHLAKRGVKVLACDISPRMIELARKRVAREGCGPAIDFRVLATEAIAKLSTEASFDGAFSNFSGLNCVQNLAATGNDLAGLLRPCARVLLCMIGRFVPWEIVWFAIHRDFRRAVQRLGAGTSRLVEGGLLRVQYPSVSETAAAFALGFDLRRWSGIGIGVPPSYMEHWARRFPRITSALAAADGVLGGLPGFRNMADCVLLDLERKQ